MGAHSLYTERGVQQLDMASSPIVLPNCWTPRPYQEPVLEYLDSGPAKRAVTIWHRRSGKDSTGVNYTAKKTFQRVGVYWHVLPTLRQGRRAIWNGIDRQGRRVIDQAFPLQIREGDARDDEMIIRLKSGSLWQVVGGDSFDGLVGSNPIGVVISEWSIMDPRVWDFLRPILAENEGWAWFNYTPRGKNHGWTLYQMAKNNPLWFAEVVTVEQSHAIPLSVVEEERQSGMPESMVQQEYYCDFNAVGSGEVYGPDMDRLETLGRIGDVPYDAAYPVETVWDPGVNDATAIFFVQRIGHNIHFIDYEEGTGYGVDHWAGILKSKGYTYSRHIGPHDLEQRERSTGKSTKELAANFGIDFEIAPKLSIEDGINAARAMLTRCRFDKGNCHRGIEALKFYHREWDEEKKILSAAPVHDWSSHPSDALRTYAVMPELELLMPQWVRGMISDTDAPTPTGPHAPWTQPPRHQVNPQTTYDPLIAFR